MNKVEIITKELIFDTLTEYETKYPNNVNPLSGEGGCCYTSKTDPSRHCIAGQMAIDWGYEDILPHIDAEENWNMNASSLDLPYGDGFVGNLMDQIQGEADNSLAPWGQIKSIVFPSGELDNDH